MITYLRDTFNSGYETSKNILEVSKDIPPSLITYQVIDFAKSILSIPFLLKARGVENIVSDWSSNEGMQKFTKFAAYVLRHLDKISTFNETTEQNSASTYSVAIKAFNAGKDFFYATNSLKAIYDVKISGLSWEDLLFNKNNNNPSWLSENFRNVGSFFETAKYICKSAQLNDRVLGRIRDFFMGLSALFQSIEIIRDSANSYVKEKHEGKNPSVLKSIFNPRNVLKLSNNAAKISLIVFGNQLSSRAFATAEFVSCVFPMLSLGLGKS